MPLCAIGQPEIWKRTLREGNFIESALHVQLFAHLTTPQRISEMALRGVFTDWIQRLQARQHITLGWVRAIERRPSPHIHAAILATRPLNCAQAADLWQVMVAPRYFEAAKVEPYRAGLCGMGYILKTLNTDAEEIAFSDNFAAFAGTADKSLFPTTYPQRRQQRRIREQLKRAAEAENDTRSPAKPRAAQ